MRRVRVKSINKEEQSLKKEQIGKKEREREERMAARGSRIRTRER
jgi:hypothetical protein